jgi:hypothetical protein
MKDKNPEQSERQIRSKLITDLRRGIEELTLRSKKPEELEGLVADAKALAQEWKVKESSGAKRPLFDDTARPTTLLLAALAVALRRDYDLIEQIRRHFLDQLEELISKSSFAEGLALASTWARAQPAPKPWQKYEREQRSKWHRSFFGSIEYQFGGGLEADFRKRNLLLALSNPPAYTTMLSQSQDCLDEVFGGEPVKTQKLEELFGMERHQLPKLLRGFERRYTFLAVTRSMDFFLKKKPRISRKKTTPGRPRREPWLNNYDLRLRVLRGIEARINSGCVRSDVASAFLAVIHRYLQESGEK